MLKVEAWQKMKKLQLFCISIITEELFTAGYMPVVNDSISDNG